MSECESSMFSWPFWAVLCTMGPLMILLLALAFAMMKDPRRGR